MSHPHPELGPPPPLPHGGLRIVPLGGLGEVGRNMTVLEHAGKLLVIDCGVLFPEDHQPGVDLILPDFAYIADRLDDVVAVVLTHGHEDHIGAVPYLLRLREDLPLVGSQLTLALVEAKLAEHRVTPLTLAVKERQVERFGPFECEFVAVNHSIPDSLAVAVRTAAGTVLHTGDFKMDQLPLDGRITDLRAFARLGEAGVDLFMVDSTNAEVPGFTTLGAGDRPGAGPGLRAGRAADHRRRVRLARAPGAAGARRRRRARPAGGVRRPLDGAQHGRGHRARLPDRPAPGFWWTRARRATCRTTRSCSCAPGRRASRWPRCPGWRTTTTGSGSAAGDTVVLASSLIPGNENAVYRVINGLTRLGAQVVHQGNARVHVSGHASAGELLYFYNIVRPRNVMPVHGEVRHLVANAALAVQTGVPRERVVVAEDGVVVDLVDGVARIAGAVECGYVYVDGSSVGEITEVDLKDRRILGEEGFISIVVVVDSGSGKVIAGPEIHARGFAEDDTVFDEVRPRIADALADARAGGRGRRPPAAAGGAPGGGSLGERVLPAPPDDHPGRRRGVTERLTCVGGAVVDRKYHLLRPAVAGTSNPARAVTGFGGVARNVAETLARLGVAVSLVSRGRRRRGRSLGAGPPGRRRGGHRRA